MPNGKKKKGHKMATHKRKKRLRKNRHKRPQDGYAQAQEKIEKEQTQEQVRREP